MSLGLKAHEKDNIRTILIRYLESDRLEMLINELDSIKRTLPEELEGYKKANADSIPLKKGSDEYKALCKLNDDIGKLLLTLGNLPLLAENMVNYSLDGHGMIMLHIYGGKHKIASQAVRSSPSNKSAAKEGKLTEEKATAIARCLILTITNSFF